jgi:hypothetical protein
MNEDFMTHERFHALSLALFSSCLIYLISHFSSLDVNRYDQHANTFCTWSTRGEGNKEKDWNWVHPRQSEAPCDILQTKGRHHEEGW